MILNYVLRIVNPRQQTSIKVGTLTIDKPRFEVRHHHIIVHLTPKEFSLLLTLATQPGMVFHRRDLLLRVWGADISVELRTVDAHMMKLRKKLAANSVRAPSIETVWGIGYRLKLSHP
jgi:DNA-binding response OmpR family regulator